MAEYSGGVRFGGKIGGDELRQLARDITVHPIVLRPGGDRRIHVEAGRIAEVPAVGIARQARLARAGVRIDQHQPQFRRGLLRMRFDGKCLLGAGEAGQEIDDRYFARARLRRQVGGEFHGPADLARVVLVEPLHAAETAVLRNQRQRAHEYTTTLRIDSPECIKSKALLMSLSGILWVMRSSMLILPSIYQSTICGSSVRPATPTMTDTPQPRWQHSSA